MKVVRRRNGILVVVLHVLQQGKELIASRKVCLLNLLWSRIGLDAQDILVEIGRRPIGFVDRLQTNAGLFETHGGVRSGESFDDGN